MLEVKRARRDAAGKLLGIEFNAESTAEYTEHVKKPDFTILVWYCRFTWMAVSGSLCIELDRGSRSVGDANTGSRSLEADMAVEPTIWSE